MKPEASLNQLRHFLLVAELGSFHAAAEQVFRTQPAISLSIRELETRLGQALVEKHRKRVRLTPFGELCLPRVRELLDHYDRTLGEFARLAARRGGSVSLAAVPSVAGRLLPAVIERFAATYPDIQLTLTDNNARMVQQMVIQRQADLAISSLWESDERLTHEPLLHDDMGLVCRDDHPLAEPGEPLPWAALRGHRLINNGTTRLLAGTAAEPIVADGAHFSISNMISLSAMLDAGLGVTPLPRLAFPSDRPRLRFIAMTEPVVEREIGILRLHERALTPAAAALRESLIAALTPAQ